MLFHIAFHYSCIFLVKWSQYLVATLEQGHFKSTMDKVFGSFQSNKSTTNNYCPVSLGRSV